MLNTIASCVANAQFSSPSGAIVHNDDLLVTAPPQYTHQSQGQFDWAAGALILNSASTCNLTSILTITCNDINKKE